MGVHAALAGIYDEYLFTSALVAHALAEGDTILHAVLNSILLGQQRQYVALWLSAYNAQAQRATV